MRTAIVAAAMAVAALTTNTAEATENWTCNIFVGPKHYVNKAFKPWSKEISDVTKGDVKISFLPTSAAPPPKQIGGIAAGTFDCAFIFHAFTAKFAAGPQFGMLPFVRQGNAEHGSVAYQRVWAKHFEGKQEFASKGVKILSMFQFVSTHFWTSRDEPIRSLTDLKTQKIWALAGTPSRTMKAAGINHVSGPAARVGEFTQTKVVQALAGMPRSGVVNFAGIQFAKYGTITRGTVMAPSFSWMVNKKKWDALSGDAKSLYWRLLARSSPGQSAESLTLLKKISREIGEGRVKEVKASDAFEADLRKAGQPQINAWLKRSASLGVDGKAVLKEYNDAITELQSK